MGEARDRQTDRLDIGIVCVFSAYMCVYADTNHHP